MGLTPSGFIRHMKTAREWAHYLSVSLCIMSRGCHVTEEYFFRRNPIFEKKTERPLLNKKQKHAFWNTIMFTV